MQQPTAQGSLPEAEIALAFSAEGMAPEALSLRIRPGAPNSLELGSDSPFTIQVSACSPGA